MYIKINKNQTEHLFIGEYVFLAHINVEEI